MMSIQTIIILFLSRYFSSGQSSSKETAPITLWKQNVLSEPEASEEVFTDEALTENVGRKTVIKNIIKLPADYNKLEIPAKQAEASDSVNKFNIDVAISIRNVKSIDEIHSQISVEIDFVSMWTDWLIFEENLHLFNQSGTDSSKNPRTLDATFLKNIWKPDIFIENVVEITRPELITKPMNLIFTPTGMIIFATRVTVKLDCEMEFYYYPADTQTCLFKTRSYSHTSTELQLTWKNNIGVYMTHQGDPNFDMKISNVGSVNLTLSEGLFDGNYNETYNTLLFSIDFRPRLSYHMIQTYLPSLFFIVITWLCFLIPVGMVEARIGVAMTTLLTLTSMFSSVRDTTPSVSYVKGIDIWMVTCIFFVFSTLVEFTTLVALRHVDEAEVIEGTKKEVEPENKDEVSLVGTASNVEKHETFFARIRTRSVQSRRKGMKWNQMKRKKREDLAVWIEEYAFLMFFLTFFSFNAIYWPWLIIRSNYFSWEVDTRYNG